jgi:Domain of unknown function (DUF4365)
MDRIHPITLQPRSGRPPGFHRFSLELPPPTAFNSSIGSAMITKPDQHDIDEAGERLLRDSLAPFKWVVNKVERDYSIDFNVQVFVEKSPDGTWLHVQLKSHQPPNYSADNTFISEPLKMDHARHFALEIQHPMFLAVADVRTKRLFWHCPQLDKDLIDGIMSRPGQEKITVRIPIANELPASLPGLLSALRRCQVILSLRTLRETSPADMAGSLRLCDDPAAFRAALQSHSDEIRLEYIARLYHERRFDEARLRSDILILDPDATVETKFWASVQGWSIEFHELLASQKPQVLLAQKHLEHAASLQRLTRNGPRPFKFYAMAARRAAELERLVHENFSLAMLQRAHLAHVRNHVALVNIYARRTWLAKAIADKYNQCVKLARISATFDDSWLVGRSLAQVVVALAEYLMTLRSDGNADLESAFLESAFQICRLAAEMARRMGDENGLAQVILAAALLTSTEDSKVYKWASDTASTIKDPDVSEGARMSLKRATLRWKGQEVEGDIKGDLVWQAIQNIATAIGVDITDESSPLVKALRTAAKDDTWDRVLIECEHLLVNYGAIGPYAREVFRLFNMKTAASKFVHCTLHNFHLEAKDLDSAYGAFKEKYCNQCKDRAPRPGGWEHSGTPTPKEAEYLVSLFGTAFNSRLSDTD